MVVGAKRYDIPPYTSRTGKENPPFSMHLATLALLIPEEWSAEAKALDMVKAMALVFGKGYQYDPVHGR
jgi:hypothetical protein